MPGDRVRSGRAGMENNWTLRFTLGRQNGSSYNDAKVLPFREPPCLWPQLFPKPGDSPPAQRLDFGGCEARAWRGVRARNTSHTQSLLDWSE